MKRKIILASHGELSKGLADTARMIIGNVAAEIQCYCLKPGQTADSFAKELTAEILAEPEQEFVILSDLYGASVCSALSALLVYPNVRLFTGMNINMLLVICLEYPEKLSDEDIQKIVLDARSGIKALSASDLAADAEDF